MPFTPEELEAMRRADEEIERKFAEEGANQAERELSLELDKAAAVQARDHRQQRTFKRSERFRLAHPEQLKAIKAAYYKGHREELLQKAKAYQAAHREEILAKRAAYRKKEKARLLESEDPKGGK